MKKTQPKGLGRLFELAENYRYLLILACILSGVSAVLSLLPFICIWFVIRDIFDALPDLSNMNDITMYGWWAVGFAVASILLYFASLMCSHFAAFRVEKNIRKAAMHKIVTLPLGFFSKNTSGKLRKVIDDNAGLTHGFLAHQLPDLSGALIMPVAIIIILLLFDWRLGLVCIAPLLCSIFFLMKMMGGSSADYMQKYLDALEDMNTSAVEYVRGIPVVKVFQQTVYSFKSFHDAIERYRHFVSNYALSCRVPMVNYTMSINLPSLLLIPIGVLLIMHSPDYPTFLLDLIFYMFFVPVCILMMNKIMYAGDNVMIAKQAIGRVEEIIQETSLQAPAHSRQPLAKEITFKEVSFSYPESGSNAVDHVSFTIPEGKTYALVGPSGGGKSTIASLIPRFWDVDKGSIEIGGVNVKDIKEKELMQEIAFVFQNSKLFKASILDNIRMANTNVSREEVLRAAHLAQCDDILEKFPSGMDTVVGEKGVYLSGGEQQRIALARAILKDAPIIILDEATAFADPENEYQIQKAFEKLTEGKTVLMIAHRLSSVKDVDQILVMNHGQIVEKGDHASLLEKAGVYAHMWNEYLSSIDWKVGKDGVK